MSTAVSQKRIVSHSLYHCSQPTHSSGCTTPGQGTALQDREKKVGIPHWPVPGWHGHLLLIGSSMIVFYLESPHLQKSSDGGQGCEIRVTSKLRQLSPAIGALKTHFLYVIISAFKIIIAFLSPSVCLICQVEKRLNVFVLVNPTQARRGGTQLGCGPEPSTPSCRLWFCFQKNT